MTTTPAHPFDAIADGIDALPAMVPGVCMPGGPQVDQLASWLRWTPCRDVVVPAAVPASLRDPGLVLADREAELLEAKGPCSDEQCRLHHAHRGPHDIRPRQPEPAPRMEPCRALVLPDRRDFPLTSLDDLTCGNLVRFQGEECGAEDLHVDAIELDALARLAAPAETEAVGYVVAGYQAGRLVADWDGQVHADHDDGMAELRACHEAGWPDWALYTLHPLAASPAGGAAEPDEAVRHAVASARLAGVDVSSDRALLDDVAHGRTTADEAVSRVTAEVTGEAVEGATGHHYLSTGCLHGEHGYCQGRRAGSGEAKRPAECKFCSSPCICPCHDGGTSAGSEE